MDADTAMPFQPNKRIRTNVVLCWYVLWSAGLVNIEVVCWWSGQSALGKGGLQAGLTDRHPEARLEEGQRPSGQTEDVLMGVSSEVRGERLAEELSLTAPWRVCGAAAGTAVHHASTDKPAEVWK